MVQELQELDGMIADLRSAAGDPATPVHYARLLSSCVGTDADASDEATVAAGDITLF
jgi:hypothetical protein